MSAQAEIIGKLGWGWEPRVGSRKDGKLVQVLVVFNSPPQGLLHRATKDPQAIS